MVPGSHTMVTPADSSGWGPFSKEELSPAFGGWIPEKILCQPARIHVLCGGNVGPLPLLTQVESEIHGTVCNRRGWRQIFWPRVTLLDG